MRPSERLRGLGPDTRSICVIPAAIVADVLLK
jgi:hypothetical protein